MVFVNSLWRSLGKLVAIRFTSHTFTLIEVYMFDSFIAFIKGLFTKKNAVRAVLFCAATFTAFYVCPIVPLDGYVTEAALSLCFKLNVLMSFMIGIVYVVVYEELSSIIKGAYAHSC